MAKSIWSRFGRGALRRAFSAAEKEEDPKDKIIGELYQVIGQLADYADLFNDPNVERALDVAAYGEAEDGIELLPWPHTPLPKRQSRDDIIEECAKIADKRADDDEPYAVIAAHQIAADIRKLKENNGNP